MKVASITPSICLVRHASENRESLVVGFKLYDSSSRSLAVICALARATETEREGLCRPALNRNLTHFPKYSKVQPVGGEKKTKSLDKAT